MLALCPHQARSIVLLEFPLVWVICLLLIRLRTGKAPAGTPGNPLNPAITIQTHEKPAGML
jgi:hypothetical protein